MKELEAPAGYVKDETPVKIDLGAGIPEKWQHRSVKEKSWS